MGYSDEFRGDIGSAVETGAGAYACTVVKAEQYNPANPTDFDLKVLVTMDSDEEPKQPIEARTLVKFYQQFYQPSPDTIGPGFGIAYTSPWNDYGIVSGDSSWAGLSATKKQDRVYLDGLIAKADAIPAVGDFMFTLPATHRPAMRYIVNLIGGTGAGAHITVRGDVYPDGSVKMNGFEGGAWTTVNYISLAGASFPVDPTQWQQSTNTPLFTMPPVGWKGILVFTDEEIPWLIW